MKDLQMIRLPNSDISGWDFSMLKAKLQRGLDYYAGLVYTDETIKDAKNDRKELNKVKKAIEDSRKAYKARCLAPYEALEPQIKELVGMVEHQRTLIDETVKDYENRQKEAKEQVVREFYDRKAVVLGELADALYPKLFDKKWVNASTGRVKYEESIQIAINGAYNDVEAIKAMHSPFVDTLLKAYVETLSMETVQAKQAELSAAASNAGLKTAEEAAAAAGVGMPPWAANEQITANGEEGVILRIHADQRQLNQICDFMKAIGVRYETL